MDKVFNIDWMKNNIADKSIDVIHADGPYFEVKGDFDFIWPTQEDYLKDVRAWAIEFKRILKDNGTLFWWGHSLKIAYSQIILDEYFNLENVIKWEKTDCQTRKGLDNYNCFAPVTEHCLFYSVENTNINNLCVGNVRDYIRSEVIKSKGKIVLKDVNIAIGTASNGGGVASSVLSLEKQEPSMITEEHYNKLRSWLNTGSEAPEFLLKNYQELKQDYEDLKQQNEHLTRYFNNVFRFTDVIKHSQQVNITKKYDHDTQKPVSLIKKMLQTVARPGSSVCIPFGGSGTDVEACIDLGLDYVCFEIDEKHFNTIKAREKECLKQPILLNI